MLWLQNWNVISLHYVLLLLLIETGPEYLIKLLLTAKNFLKIIDHNKKNCNRLINIRQIFDTPLFSPHNTGGKTDSNILRRHFILMCAWDDLPDQEIQ